MNLQHLLNQKSRNEPDTPHNRGSGFLSSLSSTILNISMRIRQALSAEEQELPLRRISPVLETNHQPSPQAPHIVALFLLVCHDVDKFDKKLLQLPVSDIQSDEKIFRALNYHYRTRFTRLKSLISLRMLTGIKFVQFELYRKSQSVDVRIKNSIPEPTNIDYRYRPVPIDLIPPVGEHRLMHFFYNPDCAEDVSTCLERFPKRLRGKLACGEKPVITGWGLQLEEGPNIKKVTIAYLVCVFISVIWGIIWTVLRHDIQGAFTISAFILAIAAPLILIVQQLI
jgi:hypothetical protein